jgi:hypothetical protein
MKRWILMLATAAVSTAIYGQGNLVPQAAYCMYGTTWIPVASSSGQAAPESYPQIALYGLNGTTWYPLACDSSGHLAAAGVSSINSATGAFTFTGSGVSCTSTTCTFSGSGSGIGSITWAIPSWLTASPTTISASGTQTFSATTAQTSHKVIGTCGTGTSFAPCALVEGDLPSATVFTDQANTFGAYAQNFASSTLTLPATYTVGSATITQPAATGTLVTDTTLDNNTLAASVTSLAINGGTAITSASSANSQVVTCPTGGTTTQYCDAAGSWTAAPASMVWPSAAGYALWQSGTAWTSPAINSPSTSLVNSAVSATTSVTYTGGQDSASTSGSAVQLGETIIRGANQTGATASSNAGGGDVLIQGGNNAGTSAASQGGNVEILPGLSTGGGLQGLVVYGQMYNRGAGSFTQWNLVCQSSAAQTAVPCGASPTAILGVTDFVGATAIQVHIKPSQTPMNASAAVTIGDTVCAGSTAGKVTDSGGTTPCTAAQGITVGTVLATSGYWALADGNSATATTTLPVVDMGGNWQWGSGDIASVSSLVVTTALGYTPANCTAGTASGDCITNGMTTLGDLLYGGASGASTRLAGPTAAASTVYILTDTTTGGSAAQAEAWAATIPISAVGSSGLSGSAPISISSAGAISCSTCNTSSAVANPPFDKSGTGLSNPTADATFTYPSTSTSGLTLAGTAPASVSTATGTNATTLFNINGVTGGASSNFSGTGGVGSSPAIAAGNGGAGTGSTGNGGAGGAVGITAGNGAAGAGSNANGGAGGNITLTAGTGGAKTGSGTAGANGVVAVVGNETVSGTLAVGAGSAITSSGPGGALASGAFAAAYTLPSQYKTWACVQGLIGSAALATSGWPAVPTCYNTSGVSLTITAIRCVVDAGTGTTMAVTDGGGNNLINAATFTCSTSWASATQSSTTTIASGGYIKWTATPDGTAKTATIEVSGTY